MSFNIAIDGPAGAGKSTIAKKIAKKLGYIYVDTGAMYRAMALFLIRENVEPSQTGKIDEKCKEADITIGYENGEQIVYLNGENVNGQIRTEEVGNMASASSPNPNVRRKLVELQQKLAASKDVVMDGRDIGTCVLPNAQVKVYLTADSRVRAGRRYKELTDKGVSCDLDTIEKDIIERDHQDMTREISPLVQAEDATLIDSSYMTIDEVVESVIALVSDKRQKGSIMEVILAEHAGFCFGVKRAVEQVYEQVDTGKPIYTYGPIIHNEEVVKDLEQRGVQVIETVEQIRRITEGTVVIRAHGVPKGICGIIEEQGLECVDATCPFVKRIHNIVETESNAGKKIVIIGNAGHPEVEGIMSWSREPAAVIESPEEAQDFTCGREEEICVVSQTTFNYNKFQDMVEILMKKGYNVSVVNTICNATEERQTEAREIAARVDVMIVIGGKHSSNTRKLYEICMQECANTYFIQTLDDLHLDLPKSVRRVGITAGASTPNNIIEEVQNYVRINF